MTSFHARPHPNGCTPETFIREGLVLCTIADTARVDVRMAIAEILHGRSYQHLEPNEARNARSNDLHQIEKVMKHLTGLVEIGEELAQIGKDAEK